MGYETIYPSVVAFWQGYIRSHGGRLGTRVGVADRIEVAPGDGKPSAAPSPTDKVIPADDFAAVV